MVSVAVDATVVGAVNHRVALVRGGGRLLLVDVTDGAVLGRREVVGLTDCALHGEYIELRRGRERTLLSARPDEGLAGPELKWPVARDFDLRVVVGDVALFAKMVERLRVNLTTGRMLDRVQDSYYWGGSDPAAGLFFGMRGGAVAALRATDGSIAWTARPFPGKVDDISIPFVQGDTFTLRSRAVRQESVAILRVDDGAVLGLRPCVEIEGWLPDLGAAVEEAAVRHVGRARLGAPGLVVVVDDDQAVVLRRGDAVSADPHSVRVARVAVPLLDTPTLVGGHLVGVASERRHRELVSVPLPDDGEHDLELAPVGEADEPVGQPATVAFVGRTTGIVIVEHPKYGRVTLARTDDSPLPEKGEQVVLDGVEVEAGVVGVARWWSAGSRGPRVASNLDLPPVRMAPTNPPAAPEDPRPLTYPLLRRAAKAGVVLPNEVLTFVELVEQDRAFRLALTDVGLLFDEDALDVELLAERRVAGFFPVWADASGRVIGGVRTNGTLALLKTEDLSITRVVSIAVHARALANESELEATAEAVFAVLDREGM